MLFQNIMSGGANNFSLIKRDKSLLSYTIKIGLRRGLGATTHPVILLKRAQREGRSVSTYFYSMAGGRAN